MNIVYLLGMFVGAIVIALGHYWDCLFFIYAGVVVGAFCSVGCGFGAGYEVGFDSGKHWRGEPDGSSYDEAKKEVN